MYREMNFLVLCQSRKLFFKLFLEVFYFIFPLVVVWISLVVIPTKKNSAIFSFHFNKTTLGAGTIFSFVMFKLNVVLALFQVLQHLLYTGGVVVPPTSVLVSTKRESEGSLGIFDGEKEV